MGDQPVFQVDFTDRERLANALAQYLGMGVCPVESTDSPGAMRQVELKLDLPGGASLACSGRVIQEMGSAGFLVQLATPVDVVRLQRLAEERRGRPEPRQVTGNETESSDLYMQIRELSMNEKQRLARYGRKTARQLLIREANKNLHMMVFRNPKITLDEVAEYTKIPSLSQEALKMAAQNRSWTSSRQVALNIVRNPSTPLPVALNLMPRLSTQDLRVIARSTSVRMPVANHAKKLLFGKKR